MTREYLLCVTLFNSDFAEEIFSYAGSLETIHNILWQNRQEWNHKSKYDWCIYFCGEEIEFKEDF